MYNVNMCRMVVSNLVTLIKVFFNFRIVAMICVIFVCAGKDDADQQRQRSQSVYSHRRQRSHSRQLPPRQVSCTVHAVQHCSSDFVSVY